MSIVYIYLLFYLEIDEQFGITAKIEAEKKLHADFLQKADQRHWRHDISDVTSNQIVKNHGLFWRLVQLVILSSNFYLWWWLIGKMLMFCENETSSPKGNDRSPESNVPKSNLISKNI